MQWKRIRNALLGLAFGVMAWPLAVLWPLAAAAFAWNETEDAPWDA